MISICIPVFNYDVRPLVEELLRQMDQCTTPTELLVFDDASTQGHWKWKTPAQNHRLQYRILPNNIGRAAIRNLLAEHATSEYLIFLDADGWPNPEYLANYAQIVKNQDYPDRLVIAGGRDYSPTPPADPGLHLHWWYGTQREVHAWRHADTPFHAFHSNNFLVSKQIIRKFPFPTDFSGYGHEDTFWAQQLVGQDVVMLNEQNLVRHLDLEQAPDFLRKQRDAVINLRKLQQAHPDLSTRLTSAAKRLAFKRLLLALIPEEMLSRRLLSKEQPGLWMLDALKLKWYLE